MVEPYLPWRGPLGIHQFQVMPILHRVQARPEAVVPIPEQSAVRDESRKEAIHQILARLQEVEDLAPDREEAAIDPEAGIGGGSHGFHNSAGSQGDEMKARLGTDRDQPNG